MPLQKRPCAAVKRMKKKGLKNAAGTTGAARTPLQKAAGREGNCRHLLIIVCLFAPRGKLPRLTRKNRAHTDFGYCLPPVSLRAAGKCFAEYVFNIKSLFSICFAPRKGGRKTPQIIEKMLPTSKVSARPLAVAEHEAGQRLDNYLIKILKGVPKSHIWRMIRAGEVRLNKKRCKPESRIAAGDIVRIPPVRVAERQRPSEKAAAPAREFGIVYEDDALLVIDKPAGVAVHGGSGVSFGVIEQIRRARPEARYLELVHRLDKDTSGLLMIAKKRSALVKLHEAIRNDHPKKIYLALGAGRLDNDRFHVRLPLFKYTGAAGEKMVRVSEDGQSAHTVFKVLNRFSDGLLHRVGLSNLTLVEATLKTGRTHQIRVHMQSQGCPIAGDERYGDYQANRRLQKLGLKRMFLHAAELHLDHPLTGEKLVLKAPLPQDLAQFADVLAHGAAG